MGRVLMRGRRGAFVLINREDVEWALGAAFIADFPSLNC